MSAPRSLLKGFAKTVETIKPDPKKRLTVFDPDTRGFCVRVSSKGKRTFTVVARNPTGKQVWAAVAEYGELSLEEARARAREGVLRIKKGLPPFPRVEPEPEPETFGAVADDFLKRYVKKQNLRSAPEIERIIKVYLKPQWSKRTFIEIGRRDIARLLDSIEDGNGPVQADRVLAVLSKMCNWFQGRDDNYVSPVVRGMKRTKPKERARQRILSDDEIRLLWPLMEKTGTFGAFLQVSLLTGQRKGKVVDMKWSDISDDGLWSIRTEPREKANPGELKLPGMVLDIINTQSKIEENPFVFAGRGKGPLVGFSKFKRNLDIQIMEALHEGAEPFEHWTIHDLRRTAKSLMSRAGVRPDVSERVLGHVIAGVEGVYDRYSYAEEKASALELLAALVERILNPVEGNVIDIKGVVQ